MATSLDCENCRLFIRGHFLLNEVNGSLDFNPPYDHVDNTLSHVYAILVNNEVMYVGVTSGLQNRIYNYLHPHSTQKTNVRVNQSILDMLGQGHEVTLFSLPDDIPVFWGPHNYRVNMAKAIEPALIREWQPEWNVGLENVALPENLIYLPVHLPALIEP